MAAAGTTAARGESVPRGAAAVVEIFRIITVGAVPAVALVGTPLAERATNAAKAGCLFLFLTFVRRFLRLECFLKEPEPNGRREGP